MSRAINTITAATATDGATNLNIDSGTLFVDTTNNNVGIGTTSPAGKLHVNGQTYIQGTVSGGLASSTLIANASGQAQFWGLGPDVSTTGSMAFVVSRSNLTSSLQALTIDSSGNVGIGVTSPSQKLDIQSASASVQIKSTTATNSAILKIENNSTAYIGNEASSGNSTFLGTTAYATCLGNTGAYPVQLATNNNVRMTIDSSGNVLIGGTAVEPAGGAVSGISLKPSSSATISNGMVEICNANLPALILGSTTGDAVLARFRRAGAHVGNISVSAGVAAFTSVSDYRLKTNLEPLSNGINRIKQLPVYRFNWISDESGNKLDGFLAHEAKSIVPECVIGEKDAIEEDGNPAYQGIDQSKIVPLLTAALKEAIAKIEVLESKVAALEAA